MSFGGASKWTPEYIESLPTVKDSNLLYDRRDRTGPVRVGKDVYQFYGGQSGNWEKVFTIPDDFKTSTKTPESPEPSASRAPVATASPVVSPVVSTPSPVQQRAEENPYFPMLVPEYSAPQALDYSAYTSMSPFGGDGGLLYQPGTQQYREAYPIADNILSYQPPEIGFPQVTYSTPVSLGIMEEGGEGGGSDGKKSGTKSNNDLENRGGKGPGDVGYGTSSPTGYLGFNDVMAAMGFNSQGLLGQAGMEVGLADQNAEANAAGGWDSPVG